MFTGIIEGLGQIRSLQSHGSNVDLVVHVDWMHELKVDQSLAHDGVCLTVVEVGDGGYRVTAIEETLLRSNLGDRKVGDWVNLERCTRVGDRLDGHIVQGHVDATATLRAIDAREGSWLLHFGHAVAPGNVTVEKGSVTVNGVSLTVVDSRDDGFSVAIIPYTWEHTNLGRLQLGDRVNLEFDVIGKYVSRLLHGR
jgi:riboflavin synthase